MRLQARLKLKLGFKDQALCKFHTCEAARKSRYSKDVSDPMSNIHYMPKVTGEDALANKVALELKGLYQEGKLNCLWFHVPNETMVKTSHDFALLKKKQCMGMIPGVPDYTFIKSGEPLTLLVELKTDMGKLSNNQKVFSQWAKANGTPYEVARSWSEVKTLLIKYGMIT